MTCVFIPRLIDLEHPKHHAVTTVHDNNEGPLLKPAVAILGQHLGGQAVAQCHLSRPRLRLDRFQKPRGLQDLIHHPGKWRATVLACTGARLAKGRRQYLCGLRLALQLGDLPAAPLGSVQLVPDLGTEQ